MQSSWTNKVLSLSTATKLLVGFGLVLSLTALVCAVGLLALQQSNQRLELLQRVQALNEHVLQMRSSERAYAASHDAAEVQRLHEFGQRIADESAALQPHLNATTAAAVVDLLPLVQAYQHDVDRYIELTEHRQTAFDAAQWLVTSASSSLALLQEGLSEDAITTLQDSSGAEGTLWLQQAQQVGSLDKLLMQALAAAREAMQNKSLSDDAQGLGHTQQVQTLAQALSTQISDPGYASILAEVLSQVQAFNERLNEYADYVQRQHQMYQQLNVQAQLMLAQVDRAQQFEREAMTAEQARSSGLIIGATLLALVLGIAAAVLISLMIIRPLKQVIVFARQVASGDLSAELTVTRRDEFGKLLSSMQSMSRNLRAMVGQLQQGVEQISTSAQTLCAATEQTRQGVNGQKLETDQVATAMSEMAATVQEVARNAEVAANSARVADTRAQTGSAEVLHAQQRIEQLAAAIATSTEGIEQLSQDTQRIDVVLGVIKGVADQTNLLALNAAIEAARAGEFGRGFSVVADEVRALARRTQSSAAEIETLIEALRHGSQRAVDDMQRSTELLQLTVQGAAQTGQNLNGIAAAVSHIYEMNQQIAAAAEQQSVVAEQINRSVTSIRDIADQSAQAMDDTSQSSVQLARLGGDLQSMAGQFRL